MSTPAIQILSAEKTYPNGTRALQPVDLTIEEGEFVTLLGPSGCGKSTLLKMIAGLLEPSDGRLLLWRKPVAQTGVAGDASGKRLAFVFQSPTLMPWASVQANVRLPLEIHGLPPEKSRAIAMEQLERVGLTGFEGKYPWQLSGGMQQRVSIARALGFEPKLLMMDEPFGALDEITRDRLNEQLLRLWEREKRTVVFVTHSIPEAVFLSSRIVVMSPRPGRIVDVIESGLPADRTLDIRDTPEFTAIAHRVRVALQEGHA